MRHSLLAAAVSLSVLAACGGGEEEMQAENLPPASDTAALATPPSGASGTTTARAELMDANGRAVGNATLTESGGTLQIAVQVTGLPPGPHGIHIHETGTCTAPGFESAGGHFNPTQRQHGLENQQGPHAGDMQNLDVGQDGNGTGTFTSQATLAAGQTSLLDANGSALVIHADRDDQRTDPSGNSGARIACGVITAG